MCQQKYDIHVFLLTRYLKRTHLRSDSVMICLNDRQVKKQLAQNENGIQDDQANNNNLINKITVQGYFQ